MKIIDPALTNNFDESKLKVLQEIAKLSDPADCLLAVVLLGSRFKKVNENSKLAQALAMVP